jgi:hypothetical protein
MKYLRKSWKINLILGLLLSQQVLYAQQFKQKRALGNLSQGWYSVQLPPELSGSLTPQMGDLRIWAVTTTDTLEAPYYLQEQTPRFKYQEVNFDLLNTSRQGTTYYYTYKLPAGSTVNQIKLNTPQTNFSWKVTVEGSQTQEQWFTLVEGARLLGISNKMAQYKLTDLALPLTDYRYIRLSIQPQDEPTSEPKLQSASLTKLDTIDGASELIPSKLVKHVNQNKQSEWYISLNNLVTINRLKLSIAEDFEYQRPITISTLKDSIRTSRGLKARFEPVYNGYISSLEEANFSVNSERVQHLKIVVQNYDNTPLTLREVVAISFPYKLLFRVDRPGNYSVYYENPEVYTPTYDIAGFINKIEPATIMPIQLAEAEAIQNTTASVKQEESKWWLYLVLAIGSCLLAYFAYSLLKE